MKEKQFDPARHNTESPAPGFAAVNTHNPGEEPEEQDVRNERAQKMRKETGTETQKPEQKGDLSE